VGSFQCEVIYHHGFGIGDQELMGELDSVYRRKDFNKCIIIKRIIGFRRNRWDAGNNGGGQEDNLK
jgi:hypothetical protein